ncbi:MAG: hypothetical protein IKK08_08570 [Clostridia bacterium]|jgi:hypothetical protein|nr:hypothetical protein [Clostridia bacterium]
MLLRKLVAVVLPLVLCLLLGAVCRWMDGFAWLNTFWAFALKGLLVGVLLALVLPIGGVKSRMNGLQVWLLAAAGLLAVMALFQYLAFAGVLTLPGFLQPDPQTVLAEGTAAGFILVTVLLNRKR